MFINYDTLLINFDYPGSTHIVDSVWRNFLDKDQHNIGVSLTVLRVYLYVISQVKMVPDPHNAIVS